MSATLAFATDLPADFRPAPVLAFHGRDPARLAEAVTAESLRKGLTWNARPACLTLRFRNGLAEAELAVDGAAGPGAEAAFAALIRRMLGLTQPIEAFENHYRDHPLAGRLIARNAGLRLPVAATPFEALTWAITGQQISVKAATALRRRLIEAAGPRHSSGLFCYPDAEAVLRLDEDALNAAGFSRTKARTIREVSRQVAEGALPLESWLDSLPMPEAAERLLAAPGIGPWTVSYTLLRGFGWLDGSLHGDVAVRRKLGLLLASPDKPGEKEVEAWLKPFSPWRALVAAHLWAWDETTAY